MLELYTIRPYFGHDCDSHNGFNNGYYLDTIYVFAESPEDAEFKAMNKFKTDPKILATWNIDTAKVEEDRILQWEGPFFIDDREVSADDCYDAMSNDDETAGYLYQYVSFSADAS